jgi:putative peptidoglycan lipid II flippase
LPEKHVTSRHINRQIFRALLSISSAALLIRAAGLLNQIVVTGTFGAGAAMDAYFVASALPTVLGQLIASALEASVIPVYTRLRGEGISEQASRLFSTVLNILLVGSILLTLLALAFRQQLILLSAPALDPFRRGLAVDLTPFIFPVLFTIVINSYLEYVLNTEGQFGWPAYSGIVVPLTTALLILTIGGSNGVVLLCIGVLLGQCLQLCVILLRALRAGFKYRPIIDLRQPALGMIVAAAWPVFLGAWISQAGPLVDQIFASFLAAGSISALSYALKLISVPVGVVFASVGRAALPYLSLQASTKDLRAFKETLCFYLWIVGVGTVILTAFMIALAHPIVEILFQRGAFTAENTAHTAKTLVGFSIGLVPMALGFILAKAFGALGKTRVLMYVTTFSVFANAGFDYLFAQLWQSEGIALATSAVYFCTMVILFSTLRQTIGTLQFFHFAWSAFGRVRRRLACS